MSPDVHLSPDVHSTSAEPVAYDNIGSRANLGEHAVTIVAVSMGVLLVAIIAVVMGMASGF
jgi:hypothetical protein